MDRIRVIHHHEDERWWAESPDVPEWFAAADTYLEARRLAEEGIRFAFDRDDVVSSTSCLTARPLRPLSPTARGRRRYLRIFRGDLLG